MGRVFKCQLYTHLSFTHLCILLQSLRQPLEGALPPQLEPAQAPAFFVHTNLGSFQECLTTYLDAARNKERSKAPLGTDPTLLAVSSLNLEPSARRKQRNLDSHRRVQAVLRQRGSHRERIQPAVWAFNPSGFKQRCTVLAPVFKAK